jgi:hypothetical protein
LPTYEWKNDAGETKRVSKAHKRRGVWELADSDWGSGVPTKGRTPIWCPRNSGLSQLPVSVLEKVIFVLGPMNRQDAQLTSLKRGVSRGGAQLAGHALESLRTAGPGPGWATEEFQARLDELIPRSWNCRPYGKEHQCEFVKLCFKHSGWQDPLSLGFVPRRPHHAPELEQAISRGLIVAEAEEEQEEDQ